MFNLGFFVATIWVATFFGLPCQITGKFQSIVFPGSSSFSRKQIQVRTSRTNQECYTPEGLRGECLPLLECPSLMAYVNLKNGFYTPGVVKYLKSRICNFENKNVNLCCVWTPAPTLSPSPDPLLTTTPSTPWTKLVVRTNSDPQIIPTLNQCGTSSGPKISTGHKFNHGNHPWLVGVGYIDDEGTFVLKCGGTLITRRHVLSAAHCFLRLSGVLFPLLTHVILGEHHLNATSEEEPPIILRIMEKKDPGYNHSIKYNDIALLVLEKEVAFTNYIKPACLPFATYNKHFDLENNRMTAVGWGSEVFLGPISNEPMELSLPLVPKDRCREAYAFVPQIPLDQTQICLGEGQKDTCQGDSGGPLIYTERKKYFRNFVIGIVAFGVGCGRPEHPGVYTYVPEYMPWIVKNL